MTGAVGPTGPAGSDATGAATILTASGPMTPSIFPDGQPWDIALLPLSGSLSDAKSANTFPSLNNANGVVQTIPRDGTLTSFSGWFYNLTSATFVGTLVSLTGKLYLSPAGQDMPLPQPGSACTASPPLTGIIAPGTISTFNCTGLNIPVTQGSIGFFTLESSASGPTAATTIPLQGSMSIAIT